MSLMSPPAAGDTFTGITGNSYTSNGGYIEIEGPDGPKALSRGWSPQPYPANPGVPTWVHVATIGHAAFSAAATTKAVNLFTLKAGQIIHGIKTKHSTAFSGGAISAYTISVGISGTAAKYAAAFDVHQAVSATAFQLTSDFVSESAGADTQVTATATSTGANLSAATQGSVDIWAYISS